MGKDIAFDDIFVDHRRLLLDGFYLLGAEAMVFHHFVPE
jgi:hypothetical protein